MLSKESGKELMKYHVDYVIVDIETTGIATNNDEIIQISAVKVKGEDIIEEFDSFVNPNVPIPPEVSKLTGITDITVEHSPVIKDDLSDFLNFIVDNVLVCHNAPFILGFLNSAAKEQFGTVIGNDYIDTNHIASKRLPKGQRRFVSSLADYYGIDIEDDSNLLADCRVVKEIYECLFHRRKACADGIIELHCHTKMSEGKGVIAPDELVRYAYDKGYKTIAITDCGNVQAFPDAYRTWLKMWNEYEDGCRQIGVKADKNDFLKVIYGLEGNLLAEDEKVYPVLLYAKNDVGIKNLYKIVTASNLEYYDKMPLIPREYLDEHRDGLIVSHLPDKLFDDGAFIADQIEYVNPLREGRFIPVYPNADEELASICTEKVTKLFGDNPDGEVRKRLKRELSAIKENGYAGIFMIWRQLVKKSLDEGYPTGIRGTVGSSFVAYLCGITDINPLSKENGGYQLQVEVFLGLLLDKEPYICVNFGSNIRDIIQEYVGELPGVGETCHAGTITTMAEKTAQRNIEMYYKENALSVPDEQEMNKLIDKLVGVKRGNGVHPGGIIVCPKEEELVSFTPLTHPFPGKSITTEFEYHIIDDNLLKLDIIAHTKYDMLHALQEKTGVMAEDIPLDDEEVLKLLCDVECEEREDLYEFGNEYARTMIKAAKPETFDDLVKISNLIHGTNVWDGNQKELMENGIIALSDCISSRDDVMYFLMCNGIGKKEAFYIMESVRKGKGLTDDMRQIMMEAEIPAWYMQACEKVRYLFPKAHAISTTMLAVRLAYYMVYYPDEYYESLSEVD